MKKPYEIEIMTREVQFEENGKKKTFTAYKAVEASGKLVDLKFTKAVKNAPEEDGVIVVERDQINLAKNQKYPCYWVKGIVEFKPKSTTTEETDLPF